MRLQFFSLALILSVGCAQARLEPVDSDDWFGDSENVEVEEAMEFTTTNYAFPADPGDSIGYLKQNLFPVDGFDTMYAQGESFATGDCDAAATNALPHEITGIVTIHPRYYFKSRGCDRDSDEKFYGSYFIQDGAGGLFVLGDSKVAHFDSGDKVTLKVRAVKTSFGLDMIYSSDIVEIERGPFPIFYQEIADNERIGAEHIGKVLRIEGEIVRGADTFGEIAIRRDGFPVPCGDGQLAGCFYVALDSELTRRGMDIDMSVGKRVVVTGPVMFAYDTYSLIIMKRGQVEILD